ncbi:hypothetical protein F5050DRAFT_1905565 [Lentinula boryana]|uniref:Uncharacterized protein n=1 Tax=Lentinula boryana TaxID=40481 RepID=A0ABQ8Q021_9AGAR|nr:hypothetical protein F5050DRAFT_1905565 [Lentinula boryana]
MPQDCCCYAVSYVLSNPHSKFHSIVTRRVRRYWINQRSSSTHVEIEIQEQIFQPWKVFLSGDEYFVAPEPDAAARTYAYSADGRLIAYALPGCVCIFQAEGAQLVSELVLPNIIELSFSPGRTHLSTWERPLKLDGSAQQHKNIRIFSKSQEGWDVQHTITESHAIRLVGQEIQVFRPTEWGKGVVDNLKVEGASKASLSPGLNPSVAIFVGEKKVRNFLVPTQCCRTRKDQFMITPGVPIRRVVYGYMPAKDRLVRSEGEGGIRLWVFADCNVESETQIRQWDRNMVLYSQLVHVQLVEEMYQASWRPIPVDNVAPFPNQGPIGGTPPTPSSTVVEYYQQQKGGSTTTLSGDGTPAKAAGAHRPPGAPGNATPATPKREDEGPRLLDLVIRKDRDRDNKGKGREDRGRGRRVGRIGMVNLKKEVKDRDRDNEGRRTGRMEMAVNNDNIRMGTGRNLTLIDMSGINSKATNTNGKTPMLTPLDTTISTPVTPGLDSALDPIAKKVRHKHGSCSLSR